MTGTFAGPLFNFLFGFGLASLKVLLMNGSFNFSIYNKQGIFGLMGMWICAFVLMTFMIGLPMKRMRFEESHAKGRIVVYSLALTLFITMAWIV